MTAENIVKNLKFSYNEAEKQVDLFTPYHTLFDCRIINKSNKKQYSFSYQCNERYLPNLDDCLRCLLLDASCLDACVDVDDFLYEFGYDSSLQDIRKGERAYKACQRTKNAIKRMFSDDEIQLLNEYFENY